MPDGWPDDRPLPPEGEERLGEALDAWLKMSLEDGSLSKTCRSSILNSISDGYVVGNSWFADEDKEGFLKHMGGTSEEKKALACVLDSLDAGIHVRTDGLALEIDEEVVRLEDSSCHPVLVALWPVQGRMIVSKMFGL